MRLLVLLVMAGFVYGSQLNLNCPMLCRSCENAKPDLCPPDTLFRFDGDPCECCDVCVKVKGEGEACSSHLVVNTNSASVDFTMSLAECQAGLKCIAGTCSQIKQPFGHRRRYTRRRYSEKPTISGSGPVDSVINKYPWRPKLEPILSTQAPNKYYETNEMKFPKENDNRNAMFELLFPKRNEHISNKDKNSMTPTDEQHEHTNFKLPNYMDEEKVHPNYQDQDRTKNRSSMSKYLMEIDRKIVTHAPIKEPKKELLVPVHWEDPFIEIPNSEEPEIIDDIDSVLLKQLNEYLRAKFLSFYNNFFSQNEDERFDDDICMCRSGNVNIGDSNNIVEMRGYPEDLLAISSENDPESLKVKNEYMDGNHDLNLDFLYGAKHNTNATGIKIVIDPNVIQSQNSSKVNDTGKPPMSILGLDSGVAIQMDAGVVMELSTTNKSTIEVSGSSKNVQVSEKVVHDSSSELKTQNEPVPQSYFKHKPLLLGNY